MTTMTALRRWNQCVASHESTVPSQSHSCRLLSVQTDVGTHRMLDDGHDDIDNGDVDIYLYRSRE